MMRVLVCGGRDYADSERVFAVLDKLHAQVGITLIIHGDQTGADTIADDWAETNGVRPAPYPVSDEEWTIYGRYAGPRRNKAMLDAESPEVVIAFPTPGAKNKGTKSMMRIAREAGVEVVEIAT